MAAQTDSARVQVWQSGGGRRIILAFLFLLLLPFYASLGPMLFQRASRGLVGDSIALMVLALAFTALMLLILQQLVHAVRTRVETTATGVKLTVPTIANRGPLTLFAYTSKDLSYSDVASVDTRNEVYGGSLAPVLLTATRITTRNGLPIVLGYTNANDRDDQIPYPSIGKLIADRAGVAMTDHGMVRRSVQQRVLGVASTPTQNDKISPAEIATLNGAHTRNLRILVAALAAVLIGGIAMDFATASRTSFAEMGAGLANPAKGAAPAPAKKK